VGSALVAAGLTFLAYNHAIILSTSLIGSYFFVRGISLYVGGVPDEFALMKELKAGVLPHETW
jgi:hypothetical protein